MMIFSTSVFAVMATASAMAGVFLSPAAAETDTTPLPQPEAYQQRLVDWVRSGENGFFHPKVVWKRLGGNGPYAMHTTVDIPKGTNLLVVPRSHVIDSFKTFNECVTVARMINEYQMGDKSFFAPYLSYLFDDTTGGTSAGLLPSSWSQRGKDILISILGDELEPFNFEQPSVFKKCGENFRAELEHEVMVDEELRQQAEDAFMFWVSRSWTDKMVPILDMYNHRNGASLNVESTSAHNNAADITAYAVRDIKAGEQLQNTYSECMDHDCDFGEIKYDYLTAQIFADYGFVELYPRRWKLDSENQEIIAEVDQDLETGKKSFKWIFETPSDGTIAWITVQLERLKRIAPQSANIIGKHKHEWVGAKHNNIEHEADSMTELLEGYLEVLQMALKHKDDPVGVTEEEFAEELTQKRQYANIDEL